MWRLGLDCVVAGPIWRANGPAAGCGACCLCLAETVWPPGAAGGWKSRPGASRGPEPSAPEERWTDGVCVPMLYSGCLCLAGLDGPLCGLFPVGSSTATVLTSGLKWNLCEQELCMGGLVSSSNEIVYTTSAVSDDSCEAEVVVHTSHPILWTCQIPLDPFS